MANEELKKKIETSLCSFNSGELSDNALKLFDTLGYNTDRQAPLSDKSYKEFKESYIDGNPRLDGNISFKEDNENACVQDWMYIDLLFQLSAEEMTSQNILFTKEVITRDDGSKIAIESYLFFVIELKGTQYTRTALSKITRQINKLFPMPVMILFKHGESLSFSVINRRLHKKDESKDVLKKVTLIKDINIENPHRAHIEILVDLTFEKLLRIHSFTNFVELHKAWEKTLDTKELNKRFYKELSCWYFWAKNKVSFPDDVEKDEGIRNATNLIRLLTRVIFIWFIKEKSVIPEELFQKDKLKGILKNFTNPESSDATIFYKAILQNLFFATLSTEKNNRKFRGKDWVNGRNIDYGNPYVYRYENLVSDTDRWKALFAEIPFLNGGLFENLDNKENKVMVDGFSEEKRNCLHVPDFLFFSGNKPIDLNKTFDTKGKNYEVWGLIEILNKHKFTVEENTPIEEEIALDPELLGKVFENLLASFIPGTKTTARKQTGSFYTPREIVDYMVDESLKTSLSQLVSKAINNTTPEDIRTGLDILFAYTEDVHAFTDGEVKEIVKAVSELKILDPACGSGAFPMGILHKLVFILNKIDPDNVVWRELQKKKAIAGSENAYNSEKKEERHAKIKEIEDTFDSNTSDYGRKLFLIENAIYGVDIQPIAVQIAKLRFFISLIVDQDMKNNVKPLPNLETKFVAANTLIGRKKKGTYVELFDNPEIEKLEDKLKSIRHKHFNARNSQEKHELRNQDKKVREEIAELVKKSDGNETRALQLVSWDPYDQNHFAPFFDSEWMFGIKEGFDVVIGNPPYGVSYSDSEKKHFLYNYESTKSIPGSQKGSLDTFTLFIEHGYKSLVINGSLCFIVPISITSSDSMIALHKLIEQNCETIKVSSYSVRPQPVFENAVVNTSILFFSKTGTRCKHLLATKMYRKNKEIDLKELVDNLEFTDVLDLKLRGRYPKISYAVEKDILAKIFKQEKTIREMIKEKGTAIFYRTTGGRYFKVITNYSTGSTKEKPLYLDYRFSATIGAILSSNLFFWFYQIFSNNLDLKSYEIESFKFPYSKFSDEIIADTERLYTEYLKDIERNAKIRQTTRYANIDSFKEYKIGKSKPLIDRIDDLICPLYGLTQKEIEFIKNYEVKYRISD